MPPQVIAPAMGWDKMNHAMTFAVLAMLGCRAYPERKVQVLLGLLAYGGLIELLQSLTGYRIAETWMWWLMGWGFLSVGRSHACYRRARPASQMPKDQP